MSSPSSASRATGWTHWYRRALPAYVIFLSCATHLPGLQFAGPVRWWDKVLHVVAFGLLAFLAWRCAETFRRPLRWRMALIALVVLAAYSAADEFTQQYTGRDTDLRDWLSDVAASAIVLATLVLAQHRPRRARAG